MLFREFIDKKHRHSIKHLDIIRRVLEHKGYTVENFYDIDDPYIYVQSQDKLSFGGVRIYEIGDNIAFRVQRKKDTHPYGNAYPLDVEGMFADLISDDGFTKQKAGQEIIESIANEIKTFFKKSKDAENKLKSNDFMYNGDPLDKIVIKTNGTDYSDRVTGTNPRNNF